MVSTNSVGLSANTNIVGVVESGYVVTTNDVSEIVPTTPTYIESAVLTNYAKSYIQFVTKTADGSLYYSNILTVVCDPGPTTSLYTSNCSDCYCSGKTLSAFGSINTNSMSSVYSDTNIPYSVSAYMYDSEDNLISTISNFSSYNIPWVVIPNIDSLRVETVEGIGRTITT